MTDSLVYKVHCTLEIEANSPEEATVQAYIMLMEEVDYITFHVGLVDGVCYPIELREVLNDTGPGSIVQNIH